MCPIIDFSLSVFYLCLASYHFHYKKYGYVIFYLGLSLMFFVFTIVRMVR